MAKSVTKKVPVAQVKTAMPGVKKVAATKPAVKKTRAVAVTKSLVAKAKAQPVTPGKAVQKTPAKAAVKAPASAGPKAAPTAGSKKTPRRDAGAKPVRAAVDTSSPTGSAVPIGIDAGIDLPGMRPVTAPSAMAVEVRVKARKPKLVRDSFAMPEKEYAVLGEVKKACLAAGVAVKKSELLRVGVALVGGLDIAALKTHVAGLMPLKSGRPKHS